MVGTAGATVDSSAPLVDENLHPVKQIEVLEERATEQMGLGDLDGVIECRIKQLALHKMLVYLYDFPLAPFVRAQVALSEAYASGRYFRQSFEQLRRARECTDTGIYDDAQCQRLQVDMLTAEGFAHLEANNVDAANEALSEAIRLCKSVYGEMELRYAQIHEMLGKIATLRGAFDTALDHLSSAWEVFEHQLGSDSEQFVKVRIQIAQVHYMEGQLAEALQKQTSSVQRLLEMEKFPQLTIEASMRLYKWQEEAGQDDEALKTLQSAERVITENLGPDDPKTVEVKRDLALLHLKIGQSETALQYLWDVQFLERKIHGSQSVSVARTLKALGTVYMVRKNYTEAEQYLTHALQIFEANQATPQVVRDLHQKLSHVQTNLSGVEGRRGPLPDLR